MKVKQTRFVSIGERLFLHESLVTYWLMFVIAYSYSSPLCDVLYTKICVDTKNFKCT